MPKRRTSSLMWQAFNLAHNVQHSVYEELSRYPERARRFKDAMNYFQTTPGFEAARVLDSFDWEAVKDGTVVDVGGSHGVVSIELARRFPTLRFIVQDRDEVIAESLSLVPKDVADRVTFMAYDFFTEQPVRGADVYFFRWIFHNWSDKYCIDICRALIPALKPGAWLLIQEILLPEPGTVSWYQERKMRWVCFMTVELKIGLPADSSSFRATDFGMMGMANSKERDLNDWFELLKEADPGFVLKNVKTPPNSELTTVAVVWEGPASSIWLKLILSSILRFPPWATYRCFRRFTESIIPKEENVLKSRIQHLGWNFYNY